MRSLNFDNIDPDEFEVLAQDVMSRITGIKLHKYGAGPDGGVDLTDDIMTKKIVVQCKHYKDSSKLISVLKTQELPKLLDMDPSPEEYYIFTSAELTVLQFEKLGKAFAGFMKGDVEGHILDRRRILEFFEQPENFDLIEKHRELFESYPAGYNSVVNLLKKYSSDIELLLQDKEKYQQSLSIPDCQQTVNNSKYSIFTESDFTETDIIIYILHILLKQKSIYSEEVVNSSLKKISEFKDNQIGIARRNSLHGIQLLGHIYDIYDVFYFEDCKYAYGIDSDVKSNEQQIGAFFKINDNDEITLLIRSDQCAEELNDYKTAVLFSWYCMFRRGLGRVPEAVREDYLKYIDNNKEFLSQVPENYLEETQAFCDINLNNAKELLSNIEVSELIKKTSEAVLKYSLRGAYRGIGCYVADGNCYGNVFQGFYAGKKLSTPIKNKVLLDLVPTQKRGLFIALVYPYVTKKRIKYIIEKPEYFKIEKTEFDSKTGSSIKFSRISDENVSFFCRGYFERFALINMQVKLGFAGLQVFIKNKDDIKPF